MIGAARRCKRCAGSLGAADRFCGGCGAPVAEVRTICVPQPGRDRATIAGVALATDRGLQHATNADAAVAGIIAGSDGGGPMAVAAAICDGVSTSGDPAGAAAAASTAGAQATLAALAAARSGRSAVIAGLTEAAAAAAGMCTTQFNAPSCTYTTAAVVPGADGTVDITVGNVGDSRVYWLPDDGAARLLTVDDSVAQELIEGGWPPDSEPVQAGAHTLTRWLGADADPTPWSGRAVQTLTVSGPGRLVLCTDGLWNYLPHPDDIARICATSGPAEAAGGLIEHALQAGGHDNITVAVIPIGDANEFG